VALQTKLNAVVDMVRAEAKLSSSGSRGTDHRGNIVQLIKRHYENLAESHEWEHLRLKRDDAAARVQLVAGTTVYSFPGSVNAQKIDRLWVKWGGTWRELAYGIDFSHFSTQDPAANQRVDPITNWDFYSLTQFEVWPEPATSGTVGGQNEVAFDGQRKVTAITGEDSVLDLDDQLIALFVSAEILAGNGQKTAAEVKVAAATARLDKLKMNLGSKMRVAMGLGVIGDTRGLPRHPRYIR
jgi:hypothetical protein